MGAYDTHKIVWAPHNFGVEPHGGFQSDEECEIVVAREKKSAPLAVEAEYSNLNPPSARLGHSSRQDFATYFGLLQEFGDANIRLARLAAIFFRLSLWKSTGKHREAAALKIFRPDGQKSPGSVKAGQAR